MAEFQNSRPKQELKRIKKWGGARLSQLRLFLSHLETAFGTSLAAQVQQSSKRKFSEFVPRIVPQDVSTELEFREIRIAWKPPRGLRDFLFYEIQISLFENFASLDTFTTPDPGWVFSNLLDGRTYYIRMRVVTKRGLFGLWSDTEVVTTPFSQAFGIFDGTEIISIAEETEDFFSVFSREYTAIGGKTYYSVDYEVEVNREFGLEANVEWTDVEFQWILDFYTQVGQNFFVTAYGANDRSSFYENSIDIITDDIGTHGTDALILPSPFTLIRRGTFVQKFFEIGAGNHTIELKAKVINNHPTDNDFQFRPTFNAVAYGRTAIIRTKNFNIFEALVDDG